MRYIYSSLFLFFILLPSLPPLCFFFFFNDTATTEIYTLSLHYALPISRMQRDGDAEKAFREALKRDAKNGDAYLGLARSEEHTSELQSPCNLVCRLLLEKKKMKGVQNEHEKPHNTASCYDRQPQSAEQN